jgi:hypothetical protein
LVPQGLATASVHSGNGKTMRTLSILEALEVARSCARRQMGAATGSCTTRRAASCTLEPKDRSRWAGRKRVSWRTGFATTTSRRPRTGRSANWAHKRISRLKQRRQCRQASRSQLSRASLQSFLRLAPTSCFVWSKYRTRAALQLSHEAMLEKTGRAFSQHPSNPTARNCRARSAHGTLRNSTREEKKQPPILFPSLLRYALLLLYADSPDLCVLR